MGRNLRINVPSNIDTCCHRPLKPFEKHRHSLTTGLHLKMHTNPRAAHWYTTH